VQVAQPLIDILRSTNTRRDGRLPLEPGDVCLQNMDTIFCRIDLVDS
jgi:hypothetical protein